MESREWFFYPPPIHPADSQLPTAAELTVPPPPDPPSSVGDVTPRIAGRAFPPAAPPEPPPRPATPYPRDDLDRPRLLGAVSGSFWSEVYDARGEFVGATRGLASAWRRVADALVEAEDALAIDTTPLRRVVEWTPLVVRESTFLASARRPDRFGDGREFSDGAAFGGGSTGPFRVPIAPLDDVAAILDSPGAAAACWVRGVDFDVEAGEVVLDVDPFTSPGWSPAPILDARGDVVDRELTLWAWRGRRDDRLLGRRVGAVLGVDLPSTPAARDLATAAVDALALGTTGLSLRRALAAAYDVPLCESDGESVELIERDAAGPFVATATAAYRLPPGSTPIVSVGDVLEAGDPLCDAIRFDPLGPAVPAGLSAFSPPPGLLPAGLPVGPTFAAGPAPVRVRPAGPPSPAGPGPLHASWSLGGGAPEAAFWTEVRRREDASGVYVADRLAGTAGPGHAAPRDVPATVDPLAILFRELLRGCGTLVRIQPHAAGPDALGPAAAPLIRALTPPYEILACLVEAAPAASEGGPGADSASATTPATFPAASESPDVPQPAATAHARPFPDAT